MLLYSLPDNPTVAEVSHAISRAWDVARHCRTIGNGHQAQLAARAAIAATTLRLRLCYADHRCRQPVVATYRVRNDDTGVRLCQRHLDMWLDLADDGEIDEPADLTWLATVGV